MIEFLLLIQVALSGQACLQKGWIFKWTFEESTIDFSLTLDKYTMDTFDFIAMGPLIDIKNGAFEADVTVVFFRGRILDGWNHYGPSGYDPSTGDQDDILNQAFDPATYTYTWQRPRITREVDSRRDFYYAPGISTNWFVDTDNIIDGVYQPFAVKNRQLLYFTLDDNVYYCNKGDFLQLD